MLKRLSLASIPALALIAASCGPNAGAHDPKVFLEWAMDQNQALKSYSSKCDWSVDAGAGVPSMSSSTRTISYQAPNKFVVVSKSGLGMFTQTSVSDGSKLTDFSTMPNVDGQSYAAPASIAEAQSMQMQHPMFCGSLLYKFFGGSTHLTGLVDESKGAITDGGEQPLPGGGKGRLIKFYGTGLYGNTSALIDEKSGMVQSITYDSAPLLAKMKGMNMPTGAISKYQTKETYSDIKINPAISDSVFKVAPPKGLKIDDFTDLGAPRQSSPMELGKPAPDFTVTSLDGKPVKLSSLRGKPVFLDFWATWCPPCRLSLPHTQKLAANHGSEITVLAISSEDKDTIQKFESDNKYNYPTYRDPDNTASQLYKVDGIPTFVTIDAKGIIVDYQSGYSDDTPLDQALAKVGIKA